MLLTFDADVEAFRADFAAFLDEHLPSEADALERPRSTAASGGHLPACKGARVCTRHAE